MQEKQREKSKTRAENNKYEKEEKRLKHEKPHLLGVCVCVFCFIFDSKIGDFFEIFDREPPTQ